jgi:hypothetical protein
MKNTLKMVKSVALTSIAGLMLLPMVAQASCYINGPIARVTQYDDSYTSTGCYVYMRSGGPLSSVYYYARSNDDDTCSNAVVAATSGIDTAISGNASACPTTGTGRYMGVVNYLLINP